MKNNKLTASILMPQNDVLDSFLNEEARALLYSNFNVRENRLGRQYNEEELRSEALLSDVLISGWGTHTLGSGLCSDSKVKLIAHTAGSVGDLVDDTVYSQGIRVISGNDLFAESVAEGTIAYMLSCLRMIPAESFSMKDGGFGLPLLKTRGLLEKSVGIVGYGMISRHLMHMLMPFRCKIKIYSSHPIPGEILEEYGAVQASLDEIFASSDIVTLHSSLTEKTYGMIGKEHFSLMKENAVFINTARGAIVREEEMKEVLAEGKIYAVLDVFCKEPLDEDDPLRKMENVILLPHRAGPTYDFRASIGLAVIEDVIRFSKGEELKHEISSSYASRMTKHTLAHKK